MKKKNFTIFIITIIIAMTLLTFNSNINTSAKKEPISDNSSHTIIKTEITDKTIKKNMVFSVNITCIPNQPIRSYQFSLSFNSSLMQVESVEEGNIFTSQEYNTFWMPGEIDNKKGKIQDYAATIQGEGNTTSSGKLATIKLKSKNIDQTSTLKLYNTTLMNETSEIDTKTIDSKITIGVTKTTNRPPFIPLKPSGPKSGFTNTTYQFSTETQDPDNDKIYYLYEWDDNSEKKWKGPFKSNSTCITLHKWKNPGVYEIRVKAKDALNNETQWTPTFTISIQNQTKSTNNQKNKNNPPATYYTPIEPKVEDTIQFSYQSLDKNVNISSFHWDFGDNTTSNKKTPIHQFKNNKTYIVTLTVWDNNNRSNTTSQPITISSITDTSKNEVTENEKQTPSFSMISIIFSLAIIIIIKNKR
ncbi:MAG: PKD domain-containing protein [Candidatus Thermoplasmatota archaeon]